MKNKFEEKYNNKKNLLINMKNLSDNYQRDFMMLSKNAVFSKIIDFINRNITIFCNTTDRNGKIGQEIVGIKNDFDKDYCELTVKNGETHYLKDKYLYNLIYLDNKKIYSLEEHDEYFEKI